MSDFSKHHIIFGEGIKITKKVVMSEEKKKKLEEEGE